MFRFCYIYLCWRLHSVKPTTVVWFQSERSTIIFRNKCLQICSSFVVISYRRILSNKKLLESVNVNVCVSVHARMREFARPYAWMVWGWILFRIKNTYLVRVKEFHCHSFHFECVTHITERWFYYFDVLIFLPHNSKRFSLRIYGIG